MLISSKTWNIRRNLDGFPWLMRWMCLSCLCGVIMCASLPKKQPKRIALIIIDVQNCFMPDQPLGAPEGDRVPHVINYIREEYENQFEMVALFQDWHCPNDVSFASQYSGMTPKQKLVLTYSKKGKLCQGPKVKHSYAVRCRSKKRRHRVEQILFPDHCVQNTTDAEFVGNLTIKDTDLILRKGNLCHLDTYSAFEYKGGFVQTGLHEKLRENDIEIVFLTGLVLEDNIYFSALGATARNYSAYLVIDAIGNRAFWGTEPVLHDLRSRGVKIIESGDLSIIFENLARNASTPLHSGAQWVHRTELWSCFWTTVVATIVIHVGYCFTGT